MNKIVFTLALLSTIVLALFIGVISCNTIRQVPVQEKILYSYRDTVIFKRDTVSIPIPYEVIKEIVPTYDTLLMQTSLAKSVSYIDTATNSLRGTIENKNVTLQKSVEIKERTIYRDSIVVQEVPIEIVKEVTKVPGWAWLSLILNIILFLGWLAKLYLSWKNII